MPGFFTGIGHPAPEHCNPADHVMRLFVDPSDPEGSEERRKSIVEAFREHMATETKEGGEPAKEQGGASLQDRQKIGEKGFCTKTLILLSREFKQRVRNIQTFKARFGQIIFIGCFFGLTYLRLDITQFSVFTVAGALFFSIMLLLFMGPMAIAQVVPPQLSVYLREARNGSYHIQSIYLAKTICDIPFELLFTFVWSMMIYWLIGFQAGAEAGTFAHEAEVYVYFFCSLWYISLCAFAFGYFAAFTAPAHIPEVAFVLTLTLMLVQFIFGGLFINLDSIPSSLLWLRDICLLRYAFSHMNILQWKNYGVVRCDRNFCPYTPAGTGEDIMKQFIGDDTMETGLICMAAISVVFRLLAALSLRRKARPAIFESVAPDAGTQTLKLEDGAKHAASATPSKRSQIALRWNGITFKPAGRQVLSNVSGEVTPGRLLVVMGPSGCGKTSLLNVLSSRNRNVQGSVTYNGGPWSDKLGPQVAYMHQEDLFLPDLTAREHLVFASMLKMDRSVPQAERSKRIDRVIAELGLTDCKDTLIGTIGAGISGGERKRLSLAAEILSDPSLLLVDEPTSGLDSAMAESVIQLLKQLAEGTEGGQPRTVIATIHQPSRDVFLQFADLKILTEGQVAFLGQAASAVDYFAELGHPCPMDVNPPEHFPRLVSSHLGAEAELRQQSQDRIRSLLDGYASRCEPLSLAADAVTEPDEASGSKSAYTTSMLRQVRVLYRRETLLRRRSKLLFKAIVGRTIVLTLLVGFVWWQLPFDGTLKSIQSVMGVLQFILINQFMIAGAGLVQTIPFTIQAVLRKPSCASRASRAVGMRRERTGVHPGGPSGDLPGTF